MNNNNNSNNSNNTDDNNSNNNVNNNLLDIFYINLGNFKLMFYSLNLVKIPSLKAPLYMFARVLNMNRFKIFLKRINKSVFNFMSFP